MAIYQGDVVRVSRSVVIVQRRLTHYRVPLFERLRVLLAEKGIALRLLVGKPDPSEVLKNDEGTLDWAEQLPTRYVWRVCWQPYSRQAAGSDLVIVTQENKLLYNLIAMTVARPSRFAFWGHGANLQNKSRTGFKERFKKWTTSRVDWWFAYTRLSAELITDTGFPGARITVVNNAVDVVGLQDALSSINEDELIRLRGAMGLGNGPIGLFIGSLYKEKRLEFLFSAAEAIRCAVPDFELVIMGDGPERAAVQALCVDRPWAKWVGVQVGRGKAAHLRLATVILNPGAVGLGILDSFAAQVPMVTTDCGTHGPEISYLQDGQNGLTTPNDLQSYVRACISLLQSPIQLEKLRAGCTESAAHYSIENMAKRFSEGIVGCLELQAR